MPPQSGGGGGGGANANTHGGLSGMEVPRQRCHAPATSAVPAPDLLFHGKDAGPGTGVSGTGSANDKGKNADWDLQRFRTIRGSRLPEREGV
mmetsp:Transcript_12149/g.29432  ORF Transcript_12149/g.29432 Transcript_12149/m.29432 type:complete len:92 (-) Transcript_12149:1619-1894(-)